MLGLSPRSEDSETSASLLGKATSQQCLEMKWTHVVCFCKCQADQAESEGWKGENPDLKDGKVERSDADAVEMGEYDAQSNRFVMRKWRVQELFSCCAQEGRNRC